MTASAGTDHSPPWPELVLSEWTDTRETLHMWLQIIGKIRMQLTPLINHWWNVPLYVSSRGLTTSLMPADRRGLEIEFDFIAHVLELRTTDGESRHVQLEPQSVATFYRSTMAALDGLEIDVRIGTRPSEVVEAIPFDRDEQHNAYDREAVHRLWRALVQVARVLTDFRARFIGKASPVHLFWGGADLCTTRFSGRPAPKHRGGVPNCPDWVQVLAYSHEVSSAASGPAPTTQCSTPTPIPNRRDSPTGPSNQQARTTTRQLGEFLLPYSTVQTAADPDATLLAFLQNTYEAAAELGQWDRAALEWSPTRG